MKKLFSIVFLLLFCLNTSAQSFYLKLFSDKSIENNAIDSIGYKPIHPNVKSVYDENNLFFEKLTQIGYVECQQIENKKINDSTFYFKYNLGKKMNFIHIYIGEENLKFVSSLKKIKNDTLVIKYEESERCLNSITKKLEAEGFPFSKVKFGYIRKENDDLHTSLIIIHENKRYLNDIVINGYDKFPAGQKKNILKNYKNKTFNQKTLDKLYADFKKLRYVKQTRFPETLFTKDSTKAYVYLEKTKVNSFDGYLGFNNNKKQKVILSGHLDFSLNNILNDGEKFSLYWKSDRQDQKTFDLSIEVPYIFNSFLGIKSQLNIFKQDSVFQNTKTSFDLGYYFNYNKKIYLGYQGTESSNIQNTNTLILNDYTNSFTTTTFEFSDFIDNDFLFPEKTYLNIKLGTGKREAKSFNDKQQFGSLTLKHNLYINKKNIISLSSQNYYLKSNNYFINELERFGGAKSLRGFNENSLQGNAFTSLMTEYRHVLSSNTYIHTITDFGYIQDKSSNNQNKLLGIGLGFGLLSKNGLFNIMYANGRTENQATKLSNSIVHISFKAVF